MDCKKELIKLIESIDDVKIIEYFLVFIQTKLKLAEDNRGI